MDCQLKGIQNQQENKPLGMSARHILDLVTLRKETHANRGRHYSMAVDLG